MVIKPYRLTGDDIPKIQRIELQIFKAFLNACSELHLTYYLHGGTLLGAKLYHNFIPWDDDIDVSMPREDYEMFLKKGQKYLPKNLFIQTCYNDNEYTLCFAKIRDINTTLIEYSLQNRHNMKNGVYIDIFPIDGMKSKKKSLYVKLLRYRIDMSYWDVEYCKPLKKMLYIIISFPFLFISANKATQLLDTYRKKKSNFKNANIMLINRWFYPKYFYVPTSNDLIDFCGIKASTVRNVEDWLLIDYPNYKIIPPKDQQIPGHKLVKHIF